MIVYSHLVRKAVSVLVYVVVVAALTSAWAGKSSRSEGLMYAVRMPSHVAVGPPGVGSVRHLMPYAADSNPNYRMHCGARGVVD